MCSYIHSDRWSSFQSHELNSWLHSHGVATSRTTSFNPRGNGQCEKFNGTIWKAIQCSPYVQAAPSDSLGGYPVRCASLYSFLVVYINEIHSPRKNVSSCSAICQWNFDSVVVETRPYFEPFEIRTSPWLTKQNYWKSIPAMPTFV